MFNDRLLNDRYQVENMIGGGGMANVYLAYDTILEREVAIKVLRLEHGNDEEFIARFHREAQSATSLAHSNIVNIYDVGEEDDIYYMVMEYVDGMTLKQYIQHHSPIDISEAVDIMRQVTSAISHAHDNEIIHRDIKPQNILIDHYGHVKVTDFGIAMALSATSLTQTNSVLGSVHYLSPEQARGGMATKKSDVYALGIVFFELLTGRLPFSGESPVSVALKHLQHNTPSLRRWIDDLPQSVENIVLKATAKDPFHRYDSVVAMENDLETCLESDRKNEPAFFIPDEDDEEKTKAIPVITQEDYEGNTEGNTIIHAPSNTKPMTSVNESVSNSEDKKKKKKKKWPWIVSVAAVFLIAGLVAIFTIPGIVQPANVEMIDVQGMEYEEAYSKLRDMNLNVNRETQYSDSVEEGLIVKTEPAAGAMIEEQSEVTLFASLGKETAVLEDYTGQEYEVVKQKLESQGYAEVISFPETSDQPEGEIIGQVTPRAGTEVIPEETQVIFRVSSGPPTVAVDRLEGMTEEEATSTLAEDGLKINVREGYSTEWAQGLIITQSPEPGSQVPEGSTVTVTISLGSKEEPVEEEQTSPEQSEEQPPEENQQSSGEDSPDEGSEEKQPRTETISVDIPFDEESDQSEQRVLVYVGDMKNDIEEVFRDLTIKEDTTVEIPFTIAPGEEASYKIQRGDQVIDEGSVSY